MAFDAFAAAAVVVAVAAIAGRGWWELFLAGGVAASALLTAAKALDALLDRGVAEVTEELAAGAGYAATDRRWR
jgi:hypothetical protein